MLDAQAGHQYEGEDPPDITADDAMAIRIFNGLSNGMGGLDWAGLPLLVALHDVRDVEGLMHRLHTIKVHQARQDAKPAAPAES